MDECYIFSGKLENRVFYTKLFNHAQHIKKGCPILFEQPLYREILKKYYFLYCFE